MLKRTLSIRRPGDQPNESLYASVSSALQTRIKELLPDAADNCLQWPSLEWAGQQGCFCVSEWVSEANSNYKLLTLQVQLKEADRTWNISVWLGCNSADEAVWHEECGTDSVQPQFPMLEMPNLSGCLSAFRCYDLDGMRTGVAYTVEKAKISKLKSFLDGSGEERKLPIVLVSPQAGAFPYALDYRMLAKHLIGIAHVMRLDDRCGWAINAVSSTHGCYNGAVRIYWPGYTQKHSANIHPYWRPVGYKTRREDQADMLSQLSIYMAANVPEHSLLAELRRRQQSEQKDRESRAIIESIERQYQTTKAGEREEYFETLLEEYNKVIADRDSLREENERLDDENRKLKYRINQQWNIPETAVAVDNDDTRPHTTMSDSAFATYLGLDKNEQEHIDSLLEKCAQTELRDNQSEVEHFKDKGVCYVYPRGRNNGGRRILYLLNGTEVRVCEIYTCHDTYDKMRSKGWQQSDYLNATPWSRPVKSDPQIPLPM